MSIFKKIEENKGLIGAAVAGTALVAADAKIAELSKRQSELERQLADRREQEQAAYEAERQREIKRNRETFLNNLDDYPLIFLDIKKMIDEGYPEKAAIKYFELKKELENYKNTIDKNYSETLTVFGKRCYDNFIYEWEKIESDVEKLDEYKTLVEADALTDEIIAYKKKYSINPLDYFNDDNFVRMIQPAKINEYVKSDISAKCFAFAFAAIVSFIAAPIFKALSSNLDSICVVFGIILLVVCFVYAVMLIDMQGIVSTAAKNREYAKKIFIEDYNNKVQEFNKLLDSKVNEAEMTSITGKLKGFHKKHRNCSVSKYMFNSDHAMSNEFSTDLATSVVRANPITESDLDKCIVTYAQIVQSRKT